MNALIRLTTLSAKLVFMSPSALSGVGVPTVDGTPVYAIGEFEPFVVCAETPEQIAALNAVAMHGYALTGIVKPGDLIEYVYWDTEDASGIPQPAIKLLEKTYRAHS